MNPEKSKSKKIIIENFPEDWTFVILIAADAKKSNLNK